jgi:hypothetical protein
VNKNDVVGVLLLNRVQDQFLVQIRVVFTAGGRIGQVDGAPVGRELRIAANQQQGGIRSQLCGKAEQLAGGVEQFAFAFIMVSLANNKLQEIEHGKGGLS